MLINYDFPTLFLSLPRRRLMTQLFRTWKLFKFMPKVKFLSA